MEMSNQADYQISDMIITETCELSRAEIINELGDESIFAVTMDTEDLRNKLMEIRYEDYCNSWA
jgi:hypothetical protein